MKLIVAGATGFVGTEVIRQSLRRPEITSVIAVARQSVSPPADAGANASKLKSIVIKDYGEYSDEVKKEFAGAGACIWTVAITPSKSSAYKWEDVKRICQTCTMVGLKAMHEAGPAKPFRFMYMSGIAAERDQTKKPAFKPEYCLMRGETENMVLAYSTEHKGEVEACAAKPGIITDGGFMRGAVATATRLLASVPSVSVQAVSASMLDQVIKGFEKEPLMSDDLDRIGKQVLEGTKA